MPQLTDFNSAGLQVVMLARITAGGGGVFYADGVSRTPASGSLTGGSLTIDDPTSTADGGPFTRFRYVTQQINLNDNAAWDQGVYWRGDGRDLTLYVQTDSQVMSIAVADQFDNAAGNFVRFNLPTAFRTFLAGIGSGTDMLLAFARPAATPDLMPTFGGSTVADQSYTQGQSITALQLPAATGGDGTLTYSTSTLPRGLTFSAARRQIAGTPSATGTTTVTYTATDSDGDTATLTFDIVVTGAATPISKWQQRTFQGTSGYWARVSFSAALSRSSVGFWYFSNVTAANANTTRAYASGVRQDFVRVLRMNKDESGSVDQSSTDFRSNTSAGMTISQFATTKAVFLCASAEFDRLDCYARHSQTAVAAMQIEIWNGTAWESVESLSDGSSVNGRTLNRDYNAAGGQPTTWTIPTLTPPSFGASTAPNRSFRSGSRITPFVLPAATGETRLTYSVSTLPAGLQFNATTRQISGTPTTAGSTTVTYTVTDTNRLTATLQFIINVTQDLVPTFDTASVANQTYLQNVEIAALQLPAAMSGDPVVTYSTSTLPAGLQFTASTRRITGRPTTVGTTTVTYTATDDDGDTDSLMFVIEVDDPNVRATASAALGTVAGALRLTAESPSPADLSADAAFGTVTGSLRVTAASPSPADLSADAALGTLTATLRLTAESPGPAHPRADAALGTFSASLRLHATPVPENTARVSGDASLGTLAGSARLTAGPTQLAQPRAAADLGTLAGALRLTAASPSPARPKASATLGTFAASLRLTTERTRHPADLSAAADLGTFSGSARLTAEQARPITVSASGLLGELTGALQLTVGTRLPLPTTGRIVPRIEIAWDAHVRQPLAGVTWTDESAAVIGALDLTRGSQEDAGVPQAGTLNFDLFGDAYGIRAARQIPSRPIRVSMMVGNLQYDLGIVYAESFTPGVARDGSTQTHVVARDALKYLQGVPITADAAWPAELGHARVARILDAAQWPAADRNIGTSQVLMASVQPDGESARELLEKAMEAEGGLLYAARDGRITTTTRRDIANTGDPDVTLGDATRPFVVAVDEVADVRVLNSVSVTRIGGTDAERAEDATSQATYGVRSLDLTDVWLSTDSHALALAQYLVQTRATPDIRPLNYSITLSGAMQAASLARLELRDLAEFVRHDVGISGHVFVQGMHWSFDDDAAWHLDLELEPQAQAAELTWRLGVGELGTTTALGL